MKFIDLFSGIGGFRLGLEQSSKEYQHVWNCEIDKYAQGVYEYQWRDVNHGWDTDDKIQTRFTSLVCNSMEDIENDVKETNKIIRSLSKTVYLDSDMKKQYLE